jgi:hypothetical protein
MAKMDKGTSKNAKTNRKAISSFYDGRKVKPVVFVQNPLGVKTISNDILSKSSACKKMAVQLEDGSLLMNNDNIVLWHDIAHLIVRK